MTQPVLLEARGLEVAFGGEETEVVAVRGTDLVVRRGQIVGLAGESGSGKSTVALAVTRLLRGGRVMAGSALWYGNPAEPIDLITADDQSLRGVRWAGISMVFQSAMNVLNPVITVGSQIDDVLSAHQPQSSKAERQARARELLQMVGIPSDRVRAFPHELSGGMRQRVMIALALALQPQLVILDEPTTALDVVMQRQILSQVQRLQAEQGFAVVFITHDLSLLIEAADDIMVMYAGRVVEEAGADDLYRRPWHPYSQGLLRSFPRVQGKRQELAGIGGSPPTPTDLPSGCPFHPRCPRAMDRCKEKEPALVLRSDAQGAKRKVACILYQEAEAPVGAGHGH